MTRPLRATFVVVLLIAAGTIGFGAYRLLAPDGEPRAPSSAQQTRSDPDTVAADAATEANAAASSRPMPETLPQFALRDRDGKLRSIEEWNGKSLVINFWATWCAPCRREIPMLNALHAARAGENVEVIGIAVDFRERVLDYVREVRIGYPLLIGEQDGLDALGQFGIDAAGFPLSIFTDDRGRIVTAHLGELHAGEADVILDAVRGVNTGKLSLEQARAEISTGLERHAANQKAPSG